MSAKNFERNNRLIRSGSSLKIHKVVLTSRLWRQVVPLRGDPVSDIA